MTHQICPTNMNAGRRALCLLTVFLSLAPHTSVSTLLRFQVKLYRSRYISKCTSKVMGLDNFPLISQKTHANFRLCNVSSYTTNLLEIRAEDPSLHVLFIPGNPGVISFYTDFLENLYELLGGTASITAVGHISQTEKNWEHGRLFSLEEQIDHKIDFIKHELQNSEVPIILVGHSIGSYISIEMFRRSPEKVIYCIGLYPFLAVNTESSKQATIKRLATNASMYGYSLRERKFLEFFFSAPLYARSYLNLHFAIKFSIGPPTLQEKSYPDTLRLPTKAFLLNLKMVPNFVCCSQFCGRIVGVATNQGFQVSCDKICWKILVYHCC
ncbi:lipid droplet-associated hydrolase isoform X3 [Camellia sinensis]|uniref:lipid droplet-associated hydrolase isoform X3 n=1 Tax=Camellia sinensis TaxID=4442 RepID=UPI001035AB8B|nr:lipid droplet-associated hydrolase isoform X3 [Camellia sinensis]